MNYIKSAPEGAYERERAMEMAKPLTPRAERPRVTWGSLIGSVQTVRGLCPQGKCFKQQGHEGECYPL